VIRLSLLLTFFVTIAACSTRERQTAPGFDGGLPTDSGVAVDMARPPVDASTDNTIVYAHSARTLYAFDPRTNLVTAIGDFHLAGGGDLGSMTDLAINQAGIIYTSSADAIFTVNPVNALVTQIATLTVPDGVQFNGLTFVPVGVLDPSSEVLVGAAGDGSYYRINLTTGNSVLVGHYSNNYVSSGDLVSVEGAGTFAAVKLTSGMANDVLVRVNPATGATTRIGDIGYRQVFGLAYWRNRVYGFTTRGELLLINIDTGAGTLVTNSTGAEQFYGAGVTTIAPILF
jgi:hypothetical protein